MLDGLIFTHADAEERRNMGRTLYSILARSGACEAGLLFGRRRVTVLLISLACCLGRPTVSAQMRSSHGPDGGLIQAFLIDPTNPTRICVGTAGGGVFETTDSGGSWSAMNKGLTIPNVAALALDQTSGGLYAGTLGGGVFETRGGRRWHERNDGLTSPYVFALAVDPSAQTTLYAGTADGVFKSTNGGRRWRSVTHGLIHSAVLVLAIDPLTPMTVYAGTSGSGVLRSDDGGASWTPVTPA
jgi:photosystem II stability/assembly factor-like uncharacterized protein